MPALTDLSLSRAAVRLAGVGALGAVGAMITAPLALADAPVPAAATNTGTATPGKATTAPQDVAAPLVPNYGVQKVRVGIAVKSGAVVAPNTSLAGAQLEVTTSALGAPFNVPETTANCTTGADGFCDGDFGQSTPDGTVNLLPGQSATVRQLTAPTGLVKDSRTLTQQPCQDADCQTDPPNELVLQDTGPLPTAANDTAKVVGGKAVSIPVYANDSGNGAPITSVTATAPAHGTVTTSNTAITYRPAAGFAGTDTFSYTITTGNGSATASVQVTVAAPVATSTPAPSSTVAPTTTATPLPSSGTAAELAVTGTERTGSLSMGGAGLIAAGSLLAFGARRRVRPQRRH
jgi:hypothetical protein